MKAKLASDVQLQTITKRVAPEKFPNEVTGAPIIYATRKYDAFGGVVGNRDIMPAHLDKLLLSIAERNLLPYVPIVCNQYLEIIDGQHRFTSARQSKLPIYYVVIPEAGIDEVQLLNDNTWKWETAAYLESHIKRGNRDYQILKDFCKEYSVSIPMGVMLLTMTFTHPQTTMMKFRQGRFQIDNLHRSEDLASIIGSLKTHCEDNCWRDRLFLQVTGDLYGKLDFEALLDKIDRKELKLRRQIDRKNYLRQYEDLWNHGLKKDLIRLY